LGGVEAGAAHARLLFGEDGGGGDFVAFLGLDELVGVLEVVQVQL